MGVKLKRDGTSYRKWWYASYREHGVLKEIRLNVPVEGVPPTSLSIKDVGDAKFERSRGRAQKVFDDFLNDLRTTGISENLMTRVYETKTGEKLVYNRLCELPTLWNDLARPDNLSDSRREFNTRIFNEFAAFTKRNLLCEVTKEDVQRYFMHIRDRFAWETVKTRMSLLSGAFARFLPVGMPNHFKGIVKRAKRGEGETINKVPLTDEQLRQILKTAQDSSYEPFVYPLVVCATSTGARIKDVCNMEWKNIDLREGFVTYVASKTGRLCEVPLFPRFREVCEGLLAERDPNEPLLFPKAAMMYKYNRSGIERIGKKLFAQALFGHLRDQQPVTVVENGAPLRPLLPVEVIDLIESQGWQERKVQRMKLVYEKYVVERCSEREIEREAGVPRSMVSSYLSELEEIPGVGKIIRFQKERKSLGSLYVHTRKKRKVGVLSASIYGWHSFRATFCLLASLRGVPEKEIINAVGHSTYRTTMKYYNNPTREHTKQLWQERLGGTALGTTVRPTREAMDLKALVAGLSDEEKSEIRTLLERKILTD